MYSYLKTVLDRNQKKVNIVREGSLLPTDPKYSGEIPRLKTTLKEHQKTLLHACLDLEKSIQHQCVYKNARFQSNIGIIGDNVGAGKSLTALAIVAVSPEISNYHFPQQYQHNCGMGVILYDNHQTSAIFKTNLVVCPHSVINQWERYIKEHTSLSYTKVMNAKGTIFSLDQLNSRDLFIVSNNFLTQFYEQCNLLVGSSKRFFFQRVFIDEADNIRITHGTTPKGLFNWFITSSVENLLFPEGQYTVRMDEKANDYTNYNVETIQNKGLHYKNYIKALFENLTNTSVHNMDVFYKLCCKNNNNYIAQSFNLPLPNCMIYMCRTPLSIQLFENMSNKAELVGYINANNIEALKEKLGFKVESNQSIAEMLTSRLQKNLHNEQKTLQYIMSLEMNDGDRAEKLEKSNKRIQELQSSIDYVISRIDLGNMCPICHDTLCSPICSLGCCGQLYCMGCITEYFNHKKSCECPCCRAKVEFNSITIVDNALAGKTNENGQHSKGAYFEKLILEGGPDRRWLVFSGYDETFQSLSNKLTEAGVHFSRVSGSVAHIENIIADFKSGQLRVLLLNAQHFGMGLNLEMATDLLIYHKLESELERQVIGRAQRPGRTGQLNIHLLCHSNEVAGYKERFLNCSIV